MQINKEFFKRESTWMNILETVTALLVQLMLELPEDLTVPMWCYIGLRLLMAVTQGVKKSL